jgi:hypothetical protein
MVLNKDIIFRITALPSRITALPSKITSLLNTDTARETAAH